MVAGKWPHHQFLMKLLIGMVLGLVDLSQRQWRERREQQQQKECQCSGHLDAAAVNAH